jgi:hypothetical protein
MAVTTKQATHNFSIIICIWFFHISVLSIIMPKSCMLVMLDLILSQPTLKGICELLVKNCIGLVFSKFSDEFALNQLLP